MQEQKKEKEFKQCPVCGSVNRVCETMAQELIKEGKAKEDFTFSFAAGGGPCIDQRLADRIPIGGRIPVIHAIFDICGDCGCYYAIKIQWLEGKKTIAPSQLNRIQRRHPGGDGLDGLVFSRG